MEYRSGRGVPLYVQIAAILRARIASGELAAGAMAPGELAVKDEFRVSRYTAAGALDLLAREGLIVRRVGIGSQVREGHEAVTAQAAPGDRITVRMPALTRDGEWMPALVITSPDGRAREYPAAAIVVLITAALGLAAF